MFAEVVFPLPFRNSFSYAIPNELESFVKVGVRVVVPFGKRTLTGYVIGIEEEAKVEKGIKKIKDVLDDFPIFTKESLKFYRWISEYYLSSLGEAIKNSIPYGLEVESKKVVVSDPEICKQLFAKEKNKNSTKAKLLELLSQKNTYKISQLQKAVRKKSIHSQLKTLSKIGAVTVLNQIEEPKVRIKKVKYLRLAKNIDEIYAAIPELEFRAPKQVVILLELLSAKEELRLSSLLKKTNSHQATVNALLKKGLIEVFDKEVERVYRETYTEQIKNFELTDQQKVIIDEVGESVNNNEFKAYLLHGITGSGKTQVYIELAKKIIGKGKSALILVPEISLTPQITSRFYNHFKDAVTVMHSRMSLGEKYDSWRGIIAGKYKVVIGPRSALFAPLENIGLIVVDEEHDQSYKQYDMVPKYHARDAAVIKAQMSSCPVILGSATPSVESMYNSKIGKYRLLELKERVDNAKLPVIRLVDITIEHKRKRMQGVFSQTLLEEIKKRIEKKEAVIILQNRRGFATQVYCEDCGHIEMCENCDVSMVYHINKNLLKCHYCGNTRPVPRACPVCGSLDIKFFGTGTQRVEDELEYFFPKIKTARIDSDTLDRKGKLGLILNSFRKGEIDVLLGTQIVSKGMDFSNVTLVGVISAETTLWLPDFRADERTFQLLTQVSGRAGRSSTEGEVVIQTQNSKHFVLQKVLFNDYKGFYEREILLRKQNNYPPFSRLGLVETKDEYEKKARGAVGDFYNYLKKYSKYLIIAPPNEAIISKIKGHFRFHILIKSLKTQDPGGKILRKALLESYVEFKQSSRFRDVKLIIDVDPQSII